MKKNIRLSFALDANTDKAIDKLATKKGISKSSVIFSIIYQNREVKRELEKIGKITNNND